MRAAPDRQTSLVIRGWRTGETQPMFEEHLKVGLLDLGAILPEYAGRHAEMMAKTGGMIEIEFPDEPDPNQRFFRFSCGLLCESEKDPIGPGANHEEVSLNALYVTQGIKILKEKAARGDREAARRLAEVNWKLWTDDAKTLGEADMLDWT